MNLEQLVEYIRTKLAEAQANEKKINDEITKIQFAEKEAWANLNYMVGVRETFEYLLKEIQKTGEGENPSLPFQLADELPKTKEEQPDA